MAMGARKAFAEVGAHPLFFGIDGLPGEQGGIRLVRDSLLDATYIYPTHGDQLLQLAMNILEDKPYEKENKLMSALVTRDNANVLLMQSDEMVRQTAYLDQLHQRANSYVQQLANQRLLTLLTVAMLALLLLVALVTYLYYRQKNRIRKEREQLTRDRLNFYTQVSHELRTPLTLIEGPLAELAETNDLKNAGAETTGLLAIVRRNTTQLTQLINKMLDMQVKNDNLNLDDNLNPKDYLNANNNNCQSSIVNSPLSKGESEQANENVQTVLIVDDNADIRAYLRTILQAKYQVNEAADGQQGLALANEIVPDIVVSDVMMPVMNGLEFCQRLKSGTATSHIPVILLTARALSNHQVEGYESGADAYITKPFASEVLLARISNLLRNRLLLKDIFNNPRSESEEWTEERGKFKVQSSKFKENAFLARFCDCIDQNLADSDLSVETVGAELGLSRVQLYRKVKALTGLSPVELLRKARLQRGLELLQTTDKTISEVAYEVGFTAPSYFTKCFRDEYGIVPGESRK
jgi:CheY-like chemotaxis protein/AraC-like DNA-binding protein